MGRAKSRKVDSTDPPPADDELAVASRSPPYRRRKATLKKLGRGGRGSSGDWGSSGDIRIEEPAPRAQPARRCSSVRRSTDKRKGKAAAAAQEEEGLTDFSTWTKSAPLVLHRARTSPQINTHYPKTVDYSQSSSGVKKIRFEDPFMYVKDEQVDDSSFHNQFQLDYYNSVFIDKSNKIFRHRYIDWNGCLAIDDEPLSQALTLLEAKGCKDIKRFRYNWSDEVIAQFYATLWISQDADKSRLSRVMHFCIEGVDYECSYVRFATILGFTRADFDNDKKMVLSTYKVPSDQAIAHMYVDGASHDSFGSTHNMKPFFQYLNHLFRQTLCPKAGSITSIQSHLKLALDCFGPGNKQFCVFDLIWTGILACSWNHQTSIVHAPYIMKMIENVAKTDHATEVAHGSYIPIKIDLEAKSKRNLSRGTSQGIPNAPHATSPTPNCPPSQQREKPNLVERMLKTLIGACVTSAERQYQFEVRMTEHMKRMDSRTRLLCEQANIPVSPAHEDAFVVPPPQQIVDPSTSHYDSQSAQEEAYERAYEDAPTEDTADATWDAAASTHGLRQSQPWDNVWQQAQQSSQPSQQHVQQTQSD